MAQNISTHTPLAGRDVHTYVVGWVRFRFLLTRPLRDVTITRSQRIHRHQFLLTRPLRDVTVEALAYAFNMDISTHTPLAGRDMLQISV